LSREIYEKSMQFRITGDCSLLPESDMAHQIFPPDLPPWKQSMRLVDSGASDGDATCDFTRNGFNSSALAAFEPDLQNYARLANYMQKHGKTIPEVSL
jgi:hypothetical protein